MNLANTLIPNEERENFYQHFNNVNLFLLVEANLYNLAQQQVAGYSGGYWDFHYCKKHQCPFFVLSSDDAMHLSCQTNYFDKDVDTTEGSIALCAVLYNRFCWHFAGKAEQAGAFNENYQNLSIMFQNYFYALRDIAIQRNYQDFLRFID